MCLLASYYFTVLEFNIFVVFVSVQSINQMLGGEVLNFLLSGGDRFSAKDSVKMEVLLIAITPGFFNSCLGSYTVFVGKHSASLYLGV